MGDLTKGYVNWALNFQPFAMHKKCWYHEYTGAK